MERDDPNLENELIPLGTASTETRGSGDTPWDNPLTHSRALLFLGITDD